MREKIEFQPSYATLTLELDRGEAIKAEPGAMIAQAGVGMTTGMSGGIFRGIRNMMAGESFFVNTFTGQKPNSWVSLAPPTPGDIRGFGLTPDDGELYVQGSSFLACSASIELDSKFQGLRGIFSGESMFFIRAYAEREPGTVYCNAYGAIKEITVDSDQELVVDTGHLVAFTQGVSYSIGKVGGIRSMIAGGEGLVMRFRGQGVVWIQTRALPALADKLIPFLPTQK